MNVNLIKEHEDGSATYMFDLTHDEAQSLISFGILEAFKSMIREGERLTVEGNDIDEDSSNPGLSD
jgi:hypothetical protein